MTENRRETGESMAEIGKRTRFKPGSSMKLAIKKREQAARDRTECPTLAIEPSREKLLDDLLKTRKVPGIQHVELADHILVQAASSLVSPGSKNATDRLIKGMYALEEMAPQNATEAMLAVQMIAVNDAAHVFLSRATLENQVSEELT